MKFTGPAEDRLAIRELCDQYATAAITKDMIAFGETFTEDAERARLGTVINGRAAIVAQTVKNMANFTIAALFCTPGATHVVGNQATGRCFNSELIVFPHGPEWLLSYYDDEYVKIDGRWYFKKRSLTFLNKQTIGAPGLP
jgi:hypothetical protein